MKKYKLAQFTTILSVAENIEEFEQIRSSDTIAKILRQSWENLNYKESFKIILLSRSNKIIGMETIATGGSSACVVDAKILFQSALMGNASALILAHNHPSGNLRPSSADISLTKKIADGGKILDIMVLDHLIMTEDGYYSFADNGMI